MLAVRLDTDIEERLDKLAKTTHRSKSFYVKQALLQYLEDLEDIYLSEQEIENIRSGSSLLTSLEDFKREL